jgi:uncharacterized membrane protein YidH (DUF202 family)
VRSDPAARTSLAWQRSSLAYLVIGVALARGVRRIGVQAHRVAGVVVIVVAVLVAMASAWWSHRRSGPAGERPARLADLWVMTATAAAAGVVSLVVVLADAV